MPWVLRDCVSRGGGQFSPPYFAAGSVVCTGSSGLRVRLFSLLLWPSAGIVVSLFTSQASPLDPPGLLIALGKAVHFFSRCFPTKGELGFHPFRDLPVMQWEGPLGPPAGRAGASSPPYGGWDNCGLRLCTRYWGYSPLSLVLGSSSLLLPFDS